MRCPIFMHYKLPCNDYKIALKKFPAIQRDCDKHYAEIFNYLQHSVYPIQPVVTMVHAVMMMVNAYVMSITLHPIVIVSCCCVHFYCEKNYLSKFHLILFSFLRSEYNLQR